eukprot:Selendium_serpulae@DN6353_c1_g1_i2.p1
MTMRRSLLLFLIAAVRHAWAQTCPEDKIQDASMCGTGIEGILTKETFELLFKGRDSIITSCHAKGKDLFTYDNLVKTQKELTYFSAFAATGSCETRKRELMAFLAETSHETNGGWEGAPCHEKSYGYCFVEEVGCEVGGISYPCTHYCDPNAACMSNYGVECPCAEGKTYNGRGPIQLSWNYNYAAFSNDVYSDDRVLTNPDMVLEDGMTAWGSALWFWMKAQAPKPSCHEIMTEQWVPDTSIGYAGGLGACTHVINGGLECGCEHGVEYPKPVSRMEFYQRYTTMVGLASDQVCAAPDHSLLCCAMPALFGSTPSACGGPPTDMCSGSSGSGSGNGGSDNGGGSGSTTTTTTASTTAAASGGGGGSGCVMETDCAVNLWCADQSYVTWCEQQGTVGACPAPQCKWARRGLQSYGGQIRETFNRAFLGAV